METHYVVCRDAATKILLGIFVCDSDIGFLGFLPKHIQVDGHNQTVDIDYSRIQNAFLSIPFVGENEIELGDPKGEARKPYRIMRSCMRVEQLTPVRADPKYKSSYTTAVFNLETILRSVLGQLGGVALDDAELSRLYTAFCDNTVVLNVKCGELCGDFHCTETLTGASLSATV